MAEPGDGTAGSAEGRSHLRASRAGEGSTNGDDGKDGGSDRRLQIRIALISAVGTLLAAVVGAVIGLHPWSSGQPSPLGSPTPSPGASSVQGVPTPSVQTSVSSALAPLDGNVFVTYQDGTDASATISGQVTNAVSGEVAELYARQFPFTSSPAPAGSVALDPSGTTAQFTFQVTPTLATRYTVEVFRNSTATAPLASSITSTIYVVMNQPGKNKSDCTVAECLSMETVTVEVPASALTTQMSEPVHTYFAINLGTSATPETLQLGAGDPVVSPPHQISADEYQFGLTFSYSTDNESSYEAAWRHCTTSMYAEDGIGLPGSGNYGCGSQTIQDSATYIG